MLNIIKWLVVMIYLGIACLITTALIIRVINLLFIL